LGGVQFTRFCGYFKEGKNAVYQARRSTGS